MNKIISILVMAALGFIISKWVFLGAPRQITNVSVAAEAEKEAVFSTFEQYSEQLNAPEYQRAVAQTRLWAEAGDTDAASYLADILASEGPYHNAAEAYKWYYIVLSQEGYSTGPYDPNKVVIGDFRNESMPSAMLDELGLERARQLDNEADAWLKAKHLRK